jgi:mannose-6-phosphate isomerase-like protein (cupin superfamily)
MTSTDLPSPRSPSRILAAGTPTKIIDEHVGRVATGDEGHSLAVMHSPAGWTEPAQSPEFTEHTVVISGELRVHTDAGVVTVGPGQSLTCRPGQRARYETLVDTEYVSLCVPAFSPDLVHREG